MTNKVLITAGATKIQIDQVRCIDNIFSGRTGTDIAQYFTFMDWHVTLLTSNPDLAKRMDKKVRVLKFHSFDDLEKLMKEEISGGMAHYDVIIHSAAVSDYRSGGLFTRNLEKGELVEVDTSTKVSSQHEELFLRLVPTEKLIDKIREPWGFNGTLVKFKLQVGITDQELIRIAEKSMAASKADVIVANCLEWARERAFIITKAKPEKWGSCDEVTREDLARELYRRVANGSST